MTDDSKPHSRYALPIAQALYLAQDGALVPDSLIVDAKVALDNLVEQLGTERELRRAADAALEAVGGEVEENLRSSLYWSEKHRELEEQFNALRNAVTAYLKDLDEDGVGDLDVLLDLIESNPAKRAES